LHGKTYNIKICTKSNTNDEQFRDFEEWYDYNQQKKEQQRLLQMEIKYNQLLIKSKMKKFLKDGASFTGDLRETFPEYYNKCFHPYRKKPKTDFIFFKYYTDNGKGDDEDSEDSETDEDYDDNETKDLLLKKIELMFKNGYTYEDVEKIFRSFYRGNAERVNLLYFQVLQERFNRDRTLTVQKDIDIYKVRQNQIETIEKRKVLKKAIRRSEQNKEEKEDSDKGSYKPYKSKKDFESVFHNEVQKAKQETLIKRKSERDEPSDLTEDEEGDDTEDAIQEYRLKRPRRLIRNTDDDSETDDSEPSVILIALPPRAADPTATPSPALPSAPSATPVLGPVQHHFKNRKIIRDDND
jgi:hypothetical protein